MQKDEIFVEQAEYLDPNTFLSWNEQHPNEKQIIKKLSQNGAKLIVGPRGSGKTTLLLKTYNVLTNNKSKKTLPIYVNFKSSLKMEPLYNNSNSAVYWFDQWLLLKIYKGLYDTLNDINENFDSLFLTENEVEKLINVIEYGKVDSLENDYLINNRVLLTIETLEKDVNNVLNFFSKNHCVLLLDDAAHAFSSNQQRDFFEFYRKIKSRIISPKAAIYPGVTVYSSTFHLGHDAEEIDIWIRPDSNDYLTFMKGLLKKRLPFNVYDKLNKNSEIIEILCYSAFGLPRNLLNMVRHLYKDNGNENYEVSISATNLKTSIREVFKQTEQIFLSLQQQLPTYQNFIINGQEVYNVMIEQIKDYNKGKSTLNQAVNIAIKKPIPLELNKVLGFFQYAGLLLPESSLSKGEKGVFELYKIHYAALINRNAFVGQTSISNSDLLESLKNRNAHEYKRVSPETLLNNKNVNIDFSLSLPNCQNCDTARISEHSKFCHNCGSKLKTISIFESLVSNDISVLPLTTKRVEAIKSSSNINTVKDILMDIDNKELRNVPQIGPFWAKRIFSYAEEYIV